MKGSQEVHRFVWYPRQHGEATCVVCKGPLLRGDHAARKGTRTRHEWCRFPAPATELTMADLETVTLITKPLLLDSGLILYQGKLYDPTEIKKSMPWLSTQETMEYA